MAHRLTARWREEKEKCKLRTLNIEHPTSNWILPEIRNRRTNTTSRGGYWNTRQESSDWSKVYPGHELVITLPGSSCVPALRLCRIMERRRRRNPQTISSIS